MNYKNKVFNKLFTKEVELSKEQIDLSMIDDLWSLYEKAEKAAKKFVSDKQKIESLLSNAESSGNDYISEAILLDKLMEKYKKAVKEIGFNADENPKFKTAKNLFTKYDPSAVKSVIAQYKSLK